VSDTRKDKDKQATARILFEVLKNEDGTYEVLFNGGLVRSRVEERWLEKEVCVRYGFCGSEFDAIMQQLSDPGKATVVL
jgi:hypothetical protein